MAKKDVENIEIEVEEKSPGFFKKILYLFLIPLMFTIAILLIVATFTNTNVFQMAKNATDSIPFLSSKEEEIEENSSLSDEKVVQLQAEIQEKEAEITQLQTKIDAAATEKDELLVEQERLLFEIEKLKRDQQATQKEFGEILSTFEKMSAKTAAPILVQMSDTEALRILSNMKPDTLSAIFTKMSPADAARYTELLAQQ
ncbi:MotE family protein [Solibacillus sp. FSL H8-0538]|uniref:MotE family protein n=1 Tax=Solibacillus sp. FSL H8-0538 TaxID=2921400 RepID=UPI0030F5A924